jgi:hypothetical protein
MRPAKIAKFIATGRAGKQPSRWRFASRAALLTAQRLRPTPTKT